MFGNGSKFLRLNLIVVLLACIVAAPPLRASALPIRVATGELPSALNWQSPARLHHGLRTVSGTLIFNGSGVEFRSEQRFSHRWPLIEIQSFDLTPHRFVLISYENRGRYLPGDRRFRFDLSQAMPPGVAAQLTQFIGKPVQNGDPDPAAPSYATIPARHTTRTGGTSGVLRFRDSGIDYVTSSPGDGRSWRWAEIETIANPDPNHFRVAGYRETYEFELKAPMSQEHFDRLWDKVYGKGLNVAAGGTQ